MQHIVKGNWIIGRDIRREYIIDIVSVNPKEPRAEIQLETVTTNDGKETIHKKGMWHLKNTHLRGVWTLLKKYNYKRMPGAHRYLKIVSKPIDGKLILKEYIFHPSSNPLDDPFILPLEEVSRLDHIDLLHNNHFRIKKSLKNSQGKRLIRSYGTVRDLESAEKLYELMTVLDYPEFFVTGRPKNHHLLKIQAMCKNHSVEEVLDWVRKEYPHVCPKGTDSCDIESAEVEDGTVSEENDEPVFTYTQSQLEEKIKQAIEEVFKNGNL